MGKVLFGNRAAAACVREDSAGAGLGLHTHGVKLIPLLISEQEEVHVPRHMERIS